MTLPIAIALAVGFIFSMSAGFKITLPLLGMSLLGFYHVLTFSPHFAWLASQTSVTILSVAFVAEIFSEFIPVVGTWLKALASPLAFGAGVVLMAAPMPDGDNPLIKGALAVALGGAPATLTSFGVTGARAMTGPVNAVSAGLFGIVWNIGEILISLLFVIVGAICVFAGIVMAFFAFIAVCVLAVFLCIKAYRHFRRPRPPHFDAAHVVVAKTE